MKKAMCRINFGNNYFILLVVSILLISSFGLTQQVQAVEGPSKSVFPHALVSHAGGAIYGYRYTNSLEALEESYKNGFKFIEIDFQWTSDNKVVAIHDWTSMVGRLFMMEARTLSLKEFKELDTFQNLTLMGLDDIASWLRSKEDVFIITDAKYNNVEFLRLLAQDYADIKDQIIPQIYSFEEYDMAKMMGYDNIILTLYRTNYTDEEIVKFAKEKGVFAITMPVERGYTSLPMMLKAENIATYVHTVNDLYIFEELYDNGVTGIYTDYFHANRISR